MFRYSVMLVLALGALVGCDGCRKDEFEVFNRVFPPCNVCTAVKMVNRKANVTTTFDSQMVQTLRNVNDSLVIRQNGVVIVELANFKQRMDMTNRKKRKYYFQSVTSSGTKTIRFGLTGAADTPLVTSVVMDGEYNPAIDTVDIYYRHY
ncbi:hypothetical protein LZD49_28890 [Dyadobacter sp. CY261]|uniref:hypothetical protein n=1 Tax=Dyadobacter sp. CY261 TaxID=2907203 RepID=UPI001F1D10D7|nr:hypothetical protein [Dyadobacter sp. CY261]MCF0074536.1 hypothetical protein [Dyadobacter sp. CY261]